MTLSRLNLTLFAENGTSTSGGIEVRMVLIACWIGLTEVEFANAAAAQSTLARLI